MKKSRIEAIQAGDTRFFTGRPCKHGHIAYRWTASGACSRCQIDMAIERNADLRNEYRRNRAARQVAS